MISRNRGSLNITIDRSKTSVFHSVLILTALILLVGGGYILASQLNIFSSNGEHTERQRIQSLNLSTELISEEEVDNYIVDPDMPRYISIPNAGVSRARVLALGVSKPNAEGSQQLDVPKNINDVGWYNCQINPIEDKRCLNPTIPGGGDTETAAILDGHTCFSKSMSCVFDKISKLNRGDLITIERGDGKKLDYRVKKIEVLNLLDVNMSKAMRPIESGREGITLITCAGSYRGAKDASGIPTSDKRVLVYAILE